MTEQKIITEYNANFKTYTEYENFVKEFNKLFNLQDGYFDSTRPNKIYASYYNTKDKAEYEAFLETDFYKNNENKLYVTCMTMTEINYRDNPIKKVEYTIAVKQDDSFLNGQKGILKQRTKTLYDAKLETFTESFKLKEFNKAGFVFSSNYPSLKIKLID